MTKNVHQLKEKLDKCGYGDRTTRLQLRSCRLQLGIIQLDKYTHTHTHTHLFQSDFLTWCQNEVDNSKEGGLFGCEKNLQS